MRLDIPLKRVLLLGGSGLLGHALGRIFTDAGVQVIAPASAACDVRDACHATGGRTCTRTRARREMSWPYKARARAAWCMA